MRPLVSFSLTVLVVSAFAASACGPERSSRRGTYTTDEGGNSGSGGSGSSTSGASSSSGGMCVPSLEVCDGMDNNCDGTIDEGCSCNSGEKQPCYSGPAGTAGVGACAQGTQICDAGGKWGACVGQSLPKPETCNAVDDDCNGVDDDGLGTISCGMSACKVTVPQCEGGIINECIPLEPGVEVCDGVDNDCNGSIDETFPEKGLPCDTGLLGACAVGLSTCSAGNLGCLQTVQPKATDTCGDGIDNDCDGVVDDGCPASLYTFSGVATNLPIAQLTGWTQCYVDAYGDTGPLVTTIFSQCNKAKLLMGCRVAGSQTLKVAANGPRLDVTFDTGVGNVTHNANGVGWYYNGEASWGFALQGDPVNRTTCDVIASSLSAGGANPDKRLCWHASGGQLTPGWRCGATDSLFDSTYERIVFHAN